MTKTETANLAATMEQIHKVAEAGADLVRCAVPRDDDANEEMARVEQIKKWTLLPVEWQPGGEELTPTMKLKRKPIAQKYAEEIEALYSR